MQTDHKISEEINKKAGQWYLLLSINQGRCQWHFKKKMAVFKYIWNSNEGNLEY